MKLFLTPLISILFWSSLAHGMIGMNSLEVGAGWRVERETNGRTLDGQGTLTLGASVAYQRFNALLEFSTFEDTERESQLEVQRRHYEWMGWLRYSFWKNEEFEFLAGGGAGIFWETVTTRFVSSVDEQSSDWSWLLGVTLASEYRLSTNWALGLNTDLVSLTNDEITPVLDMALVLKYLF